MSSFAVSVFACACLCFLEWYRAVLSSCLPTDFTHIDDYVTIVFSLTIFSLHPLQLPMDRNSNRQKEYGRLSNVCLPRLCMYGARHLYRDRVHVIKEDAPRQVINTSFR